MKRQFAITCGLGNSRQNEGSNLIEAAKSGDYTTIRRISADCLSDIHTEDKVWAIDSDPLNHLHSCYSH